MGTAAQILKVFLFAASLFLGAGFFAGYASAQNLIQITDVTGTSNFTNGTAQDSPKIYAGIAGADCGAAVGNSTTSTCNSCITAGVDPAACNPSRIHTSLELSVSFTVTGELTGTIYAFAKASGGTPSTITSYSKSPTTSITKGATGSITVSWGVLCPALGAGACDTPQSDTAIYICILPNSTYDSSKCVEIPTIVWEPTTTTAIDCPVTRPTNYGVCRFTAFPGDEKITVSDLDLTSANSDNVPATKMIVLFSDVGFDSIDQTTYGSSYAELDVDSAGDVSPDVVEGLENDVPYFFKTAVMDTAQNLYYFTSDNEIADACSVADPSTLTAADDATCDYIATPSKVYGLLTEDLNCFITTAAYGSSFAPKVIDFRAFRNKFLVPSTLGRKIIYYYYDIGPKAARWLGQNEWAKPAVRSALFPAWLFVETAQILGLTAATVFFVSFFILLFCGVKIIKRRVTI